MNIIDIQQILKEGKHVKESEYFLYPNNKYLDINCFQQMADYDIDYAYARQSNITINNNKSRITYPLLIRYLSVTYQLINLIVPVFLLCYQYLLKQDSAIEKIGQQSKPEDFF